MAEQKFFVDKHSLEEDYRQLKSMLRIATKYGVSKKLIMNYMNRYEIPRDHKDSTDKVQAIRFLASQGKTSTEIGEAITMSLNEVNRHIKKHGIEVTRYHKGYVKTDSGYILIFCPDHPNSDKKGYVRQHILVMTQQLGRALNGNEVVHHKDENKANNELQNLELMTDSNHKSYHSKKPRKRNIQSEPL